VKVIRKEESDGGKVGVSRMGVGVIVGSDDGGGDESGGGYGLASNTNVGSGIAGIKVLTGGCAAKVCVDSGGREVICPENVQDVAMMANPMILKRNNLNICTHLRGDAEYITSGLPIASTAILHHIMSIEVVLRFHYKCYL
jgi:hypothetical protein